MKKMIRFLLLLAIVIQYPACGSKEEYKVDEFEVTFELPSLVDITQGGEYTFNVKDGKSPSTTDSFIFESEDGISFICPIISSSSSNFTIRLANNVKSGYHQVLSKEIPERNHSGKPT